jgi:ABC-type phosphate/phosphonate transport system substrate-binding protein
LNGNAGWQLALPMYNNSPGLAEAARVLLRRVIDGLRAQGWTEPMALAEVGDDLVEFWQSPRMLLSQTCGYPLVTQLRERVEVLARPHYRLPGCVEHSYCSFVVTRADADIADLAGLQGKRLAANSLDSHSGMNALRHLLAPLAAQRSVNGRFFQQVRWSGGHANSLAMLQAGQADCAAIDCVTFAYCSEHRPALLQGLRVIAQTAQAPSLPWICSKRLSAAQTNCLRQLVLDLPASAPVAGAMLHLEHFESSSLASYDPILDMECSAIAQGYGVLQ